MFIILILILGWIFGTIITVSLIGSSIFLVYYYGIRYGMIRNWARHLGLTDNTQIEHQLLNQFHSNTIEEEEIAM